MYKVIEEWDDRGNRQSIDRQEHEIEQISKAIYQASELLLDKEGSLNIISGNDQNQSTNYFYQKFMVLFRTKASLKRHITCKNVIIRAPESVSIYKISSSRFGCPPLGRIYYDTEISREAN